MSDPHLAHSEAALAVDVGSAQDPPQTPGLAHFCEHMLFQGSEKFPERNFLNTLVAENGGSTNAYTRLDLTNYFFSSNNEGKWFALSLCL